MKQVVFKAFCILTLSVITIYAQGNPINSEKGDMPKGFISGSLMDAQTGQPIEYGNVILFRYKDSLMVSGTVSGKHGVFTLNDIPFGNYFLKASYIGYAQKRIDSLRINPRGLSLMLGEIKLDESSIELSNIVVTGDKQMVINNLDKKVINVEKDLTATGGTAVDVVQNIPSVSVDADGNVSFRGNKNLTILVDGKPAELMGLGSGDVLLSIPASSIESVELVTNPSARYDPDGTAGILNIILKKKLPGGMNGIISLTAGTGDKYNGSLNFTYKTPKFNFFSSYDARMNKSKNNGNSIRTNSLSNSLSSLNTNSNGIFDMGSHNLTAGIDYLADNFNTITFSLRFRNFNFGNFGQVKNKSLNSSNLITNYFERTNDADRSMNSMNYTLNFRRTFENKDEELTADVIYGENRMKRDEDIAQKNFNTDLTPVNEPLILSQGLSSNKNRQLTIQSNYINPIEGFGRIETGFKINFKKFNSKNDYLNFDYGSSAWKNDILRKTDFDYNEQIYSIYGIYSNNFDKFQFQFGMRLENSSVKGEENLSTAAFSNHYFTIYPTVHLVQSLPAQQEVQLSYSRRVERPNNRQLNPYVDKSDSLNISFGNPELKPEFINSFELGYSKLIDKAALTSSIFYKYTTNAINNFTAVNNNGVSETTWKNLAKNISYGLELTAAHPFLDWIRLNGSFIYFSNEYIDDNLSSRDFTWQTKLTSMFMFSRDFNLQLNFNYNAREVIPQGKVKQVYFADAAVKKDFLDGQLSLTFRITDIFNTRKFETETNGFNFTNSSYRKMESRAAYLGVTFRLNPGNNNRERKPRNEESTDDF